MESIIKWNKGTPNIEGNYLVVTDKKEVTYDYLIVWNDIKDGQFVKKTVWRNHQKENVISWYNISDIKLENKTV